MNRMNFPLCAALALACAAAGVQAQTAYPRRGVHSSERRYLLLS